MREPARVETPALVPRVSWAWKRFEALPGDDVYDALALRGEVFVVEQHAAFLDADGCDRAAWHLLGRADVTGETGAPLAAYLRCLDPGVKYAQPSIGRVIVAASYRGTGLGRVLMREGIARTRASWPAADIVIAAQQRLECFYASLGFRIVGRPYIEDGIDHVEMRLASNTRLEENRR